MGQMGAQNNYMQGMFNQGINPLEQSLLGASGALGLQQLQRQDANIGAQFAGSPFHSALAPAELDAANTFGNQLNQTAAQEALSRQGQAAQLAGLPGQQASQAATNNVNTGSALFNQLMGSQFQGLQPGMSLFGQVPIPSPVVSQGSVIATQGGGQGKK